MGAALNPKLLPDTVINPPLVGLPKDTKDTDGGPKVNFKLCTLNERSNSLYLNAPVVPELAPAETETMSPVAAPDANAPENRNQRRGYHGYEQSVSFGR
jgi:hypothetical protein